MTLSVTNDNKEGAVHFVSLGVARDYINQSISYTDSNETYKSCYDTGSYWVKKSKEMAVSDMRRWQFVVLCHGLRGLPRGLLDKTRLECLWLVGGYWSNRTGTY